jgi:hypothetical protein
MRLRNLMSTTLRDAFSVTRFSFWTGVMLSTLVGSGLYVVTTRSIESDVQERFVRHAKYAQAVINMRLKSYTDLLRGAASVLQSGDTISHRQFHDYVNGLHLARNYPAVDTLNFARWVREDERPAFQRELTQELQAFLGPEARAVITPSGIRPGYLVVTYIEPDATNTRLYGLDLMSNPYFRRQLVQSRDDGLLRASGRPIAALSAPGDNHLGMRLPVYRHGPRLTGVEQRRADYLGSLGIAFSLPKLLHGVMDEIPVPDVRMTLFDVGPREVIGHDTTTWPKVLFDSRATAANPTPPLRSRDDERVAVAWLSYRTALVGASPGSAGTSLRSVSTSRAPATGNSSSTPLTILLTPKPMPTEPR